MKKIVRRLDKETGQRVDVVEDMTEAEIASLAPSNHDRIAAIRSALAEADTSLIRVIEDLAVALLDKGVITPDELPEDAIAKINARRDHGEVKALRDELKDKNAIKGER